jgi:Ankyrin repeats (3 copies)
MSQPPSLDDITIQLTHSEEDDALYPGSFIYVNADILIGVSQKKKIGSINATLVNRQAIAERGFYEAFDSHSSDMQWIGCAVMENRRGRTKLQSLLAYDDTEVDFMYIEKFHMDHEYKQDGSSDVGAKALRLFLHHTFIKGENVEHDSCWWKVSSAAYVLDPMEAMTPAQRTHFKEQQDAHRAALTPFNNAESEMQKNEQARYFAELERADANPFLRNCFFQDPALARNGGSDARILVASCAHMSQPLKTHEQALSVTFSPLPPQITGNDAQILDAVKNGCSGVLFSNQDVDANQLQNLVREINSYRSAGGSILRSNALHAAVSNNSLQVVTWLLEQEPTAVNSRDSSQSTPLMVAAASAFGRSSIRGIPDTLVMDKLLASGADKSAQDDLGMTAFGRFKSTTSGFSAMVGAVIGQHALPVFNSRAMLGDILGPGAGMGGAGAATAGGGAGITSFLTCQDVEMKLCPPGGPSRGDLSGGIAAQSGLVDYTEQDRQNDREMGIYDDDDEDSMEGDY